VERRDFDFPGAVSAIETYCQKNLIPRRMCNRLHLAFEELMEQILLPKLENPDIRFTAEYSESGGEIDVTVRYNGCLSPEDTSDSLSWTVLKGAFPDLTHEACQPASEESYTNRVRLCIC
jgi:hypothetical protein